MVELQRRDEERRQQMNAFGGGNRQAYGGGPAMDLGHSYMAQPFDMGGAPYGGPRMVEYAHGAAQHPPLGERHQMISGHKFAGVGEGVQRLLQMFKNDAMSAGDPMAALNDPVHQTAYGQPPSMAPYSMMPSGDGGCLRLFLSHSLQSGTTKDTVVAAASSRIVIAPTIAATCRRRAVIIAANRLTNTTRADTRDAARATVTATSSAAVVIRSVDAFDCCNDESPAPKYQCAP